MRRMYSQAELSAIIKEVFLADVASGQIDLPALIEQALPEVDFTELDFVAKTLSQVEPNYSLEFEFTSTSNLEITNIYNRFMVINNMLYIIVNVAMKNISGASLTINVNDYITGKNLAIDEAIASKIYGLDGKKASETPVGSYSLITPLQGYSTSSITSNYPSPRGDIRVLFINKSPANETALALTNGVTSFSLNADQVVYYTGRVALSLI